MWNSLLLMIPAVAAQCAIMGDCGPISRFGNSLPCVANSSSPLKLEEQASIDTLTDLCGAELASNAVCCSPEQVVDLSTNLKRVEPLIGSCPACLQNFRDLFCQFTCSPQQHEFVKIRDVQSTLKGELAPKRVEYFVDPALAANFYSSCKDVKFSATNGKAMDLIGGRASNYTEFLKFLGDEKPMLGGSVFQIDFPFGKLSKEDKPIRRMNDTTHWQCGEGEKKCSCIDCESSCPTLPSIPGSNEENCRMGPFRCDSMALIISYITFIVFALLFWLAQRQWQQRSAEDEVSRLIEDDEVDGGTGDDPFAVPSSELGSLNLRAYRLDLGISRWLRKQGSFCARYPGLVVALCILFVCCSSLGLIGMQIETDPFNLWVAADSREAYERQFFNSHFGGGFYRTAQLFVVNDDAANEDSDDSAVLQSYSTLEWLKSVEQRVADIRTPVLQDSLHSFCLKPVNDACVVESVTQYGVGDTPQWKTRLQNCVKQPVNCLPRFQQPIDPQIIFGGADDTGSPEELVNSPALVTTWVLQNSEDNGYKFRVEEWEEQVEHFLANTVTEEAASKGLRISYNVESSLERELGRSGLSDIHIIALSYLLMFAYVAWSLGESPFIGLAGVLVVLCSVGSAVGLLSMAGFKLTLIITEVIPFLALAIGVDNIFLISHALALVAETSPELVTIEDQISASMASIGPSIVLSTSCEAAALAIAACVPMPAVRNFALFACVAVLLNSGLQLTLFVAVLAAYKRRQQEKALHMLFVQQQLIQHQNMLYTTRSQPQQDHPPLPDEMNDQAYSHATYPLPDNQGNLLNANELSRRLSSGPTESVRSWRQSESQQTDPRHFAMIFSEYTPRLLSRRVKQCVGLFFLLWLAVSLFVLPQISLGLDQRMAVPTDSFLVDYFSDVYQYLNVGPPTYFVVPSKGSHVENRFIQQKMCSRFSTCDSNSVVNELEMEHKRPEVSYLTSSPASWIDDFLMWLNPSLDQCCVEPKGGTCYADKPWGFDMEGFPEGKNFTHYLQLWLSQPSDKCPLAGKAPYGQSISLKSSNGRVDASHFRMNHVPLRSQNDYIAAYSAARTIASRLSDITGLDVFPYSIFYAFFAQYLNIVPYSLQLVGAAILVTGLLAWVLLGSFRTAALVALVVMSLTINVCGLMYFWGISLNGLSLVNLIICVGLGVEFCIHIARSFTFVARVRAIGIRGFSRVDRSYNALVGTGGSVFGGVAITKLLGVCVLAFAHSRIFHVYYFLMWLALVICATLHSLVLLPVVLSQWGGKAWLVEGESAGLVDLEEEL